MVQWKPQHPLIELIPQAAQHALANLPFLYVQMEFEPTADQNKSQKYKTQH
jgi:hypothetical protein